MLSAYEYYDKPRKIPLTIRLAKQHLALGLWSLNIILVVLSLSVIRILCLIDLQPNSGSETVFLYF